ncbi:MAG: hypothetical protein J6X48_03920 [Lachnospiraceae bacterium]|nr:hypothetical protein [Lachnospiraceae bacterium]
MPFFLGLLPTKKNMSVKITWVAGFLCEWAIVYVCFLPCIIKGFHFSVAAKFAVIGCLILSLAGIVLAFIEKRFKDLFSVKRNQLSKREIVYLGIFLAVVLFQLYKTIFFAYEDGDDAFYVATSQIADSSDTMYRLDAYIGIPVEVNYRYALAPFPMWIALLARLSKVNVATIAHSVVAPVLILVTYAIYSEISKLIFENDNKKRYLFLMLLSIFFMFENVSTSTQGTFLLTRARQGKEALANVILPFLFLTLYRISKDNLKISFKDWLLLITTCTAAALTSLLGNILAPLMIFALFIYMIVKKQKITRLFVLGSTVLPSMLAVLLYVKY